MSKWDIWWDFRDDWVVVQTDHRDYNHIDVICKFALSGPDMDEFEEWFHTTRKDLMSGRVSFHKWMKEMGHARKS